MGKDYPGDLDENTSRSVSVRKVDNGYIKCVSESGPGGYTSRETIHETNPGLDSKPKSKVEGPSSLKRAIDSMKVVALIWGLLGASVGLAQTPVQVIPTPATPTNGSGSIAVTNTFQSVFTAVTYPAQRRGCFFQNIQGSGDMFIFFGAPASATTATSVKLTSALKFSCSELGYQMMPQTQISITGTAGGLFLAIQE